MTKEEIDRKYIDQANALEAEFFDIKYELDSFGWPIGQHRELKTNKSEADFISAHGSIWQAHEAELIAEGFIQPVPVQLPGRDLAAEIDVLKGKVKALEKK